MTEGNYDESEILPYKVGCGGVVVRKKGQDYEVLCLYRSAQRFGMKGDSYHLPKGTLEPEETLEKCALREVLEESGAECETICYIGATNSELLSRNTEYKIDYVRHFFLMKCLKLNEVHDQEHDEVRWLSVDEAIKKFAELPKEEDKIVGRAIELLKTGKVSL